MKRCISMGKRHRLESPYEVADKALAKLLEKIDEMTSHYNEAMYRFSSDPDAQSRYLAGVATWVATMRSPEVRSAISSAIQEAKKRYRQLIQSYTKEKVKVPVYA